jgi:chemotaxis family two-component system response regulator Rcp1
LKEFNVGRSSRNVLIIEDNPGDVRLMHEALRKLHPLVTIYVAENSEQALDFLLRRGTFAKAPRPDLIFLDFNLPKSDSRELLQHIKQNRETRLIPVAVLTSSEADHDVRAAYELHANCYLRKPVDLDSFLNMIQTAAHFWLEVAQIPREAP